MVWNVQKAVRKNVREKNKRVCMQAWDKISTNLNVCISRISRSIKLKFSVYINPKRLFYIISVEID